MLRIENFDDIASGRRDCATVADLSAGFSVERSCGGQLIDFVALDRLRLSAVATVYR